VPALVLVAFCGAALLWAGDTGSPSKEALQELNDYIGGWKGNGTSEKDRRLIWKESVDWSWRFQKGKEPSLVFNVEKGKYIKKGELRYLPAKKVYELALEDVDGKHRVFEGVVKKKKLVLERQDTDKKEKQKLEMNLAGDGARLIYTYFVMPEDRTLYGREFQVGYTRLGESFGTAAKKAECIVTGGLGTMPVMYKGVTYYVCCSGCRDAFNETPEKFIKEFNAKKK
jgi:hypothetical protein